VGILFLLIFISSIPVIAVFIWFRLARYPFSVPMFFISLLAGTASFFPALLFQNIIPAGSGIFNFAGKWSLFTEILIRIAFTEELSLLLILSILFIAIRRFFFAGQNLTGQENPVSAAGFYDISMVCASGLIAGFGFAVLESAVYGASNPFNALIRVFTSVPLHGACGFRVGSSIVLFREHPARGFFRFLSAVVIHGAYNFMLIIPGRLSFIAAILIVVSAMATAIRTIHNSMKCGNTNQKNY
jgi:RsiW-degrading membrane proteinase PrsW (M82 family)